MIYRATIGQAYDYRVSQNDTLVIPEWIFKQLHIITFNKNESVGYLIANRTANHHCKIYLVEGLLLSNTGETGYVGQTRTIRLNNPDMIAIEFHTHVNALGEVWQDKFSGGDYNTFKSRVEEDKDYNHCLFTTSHILTFSENNSLRVKIAMGNDSIVQSIFYKWKEKLTELERKLI